MINVAVIGCGYWGPNIARNLSALPTCRVAAVCDLERERAEKLQRLYPTARAVTRAEEIFADPEITAVAVCTPVGSHFALADAALRAGKHVLVEKPLSDSVERSQALEKLARERGLVLQVDHTFVYSPGVQKIRSLIERGELGDLLYVDAVRINLGLFQPDINVVWDLATHDISIISYLADRPLLWVSAIGRAYPGRFESQAYLTMMFEGDLLTHLHVNWLAPVKIRSMVIGGSKRMVVYDDLEPSEKIRVYDKAVTLNDDPARRAQALVDYRIGDMFAPYVDKYEPLSRVCESFLAAIEDGTRPLTDGVAGIEVVRVLEAAQQSIRKNGERIHLDSSHRAR